VTVDHSSAPLPSIDTLRAFDAAVRLGSISRAAAHIHLTHGAVSRRIAALEDAVGLPLLERRARGVLPTADGLRLHAVVAEALDRLRAGLLEATARRAAPAPVRVSVLPSFATHFLMPHLAKFFAAHPAIDLQLVAESRPADLQRDRIDLAIRLGTGAWPGVRAELLMHEELFPVYSATLRRRLDSPRQLEGQTLLHDDNEEGWRVWLQAVGWRVPRTKSVTYSDYNLVLEAAANGLGFAMGRGPLVAHLVASGRLLAAHATTAHSPRQYYLITSGAPQRAEVKAFIDWLRGQCRLAARPRRKAR
jgi:DNA-binding transcriptional LysR family regulator